MYRPVSRCCSGRTTGMCDNRKRPVGAAAHIGPPPAPPYILRDAPSHTDKTDWFLPAAGTDSPQCIHNRFPVLPGRCGHRPLRTHTDCQHGCRAGACPRRRYAFAPVRWGTTPYSARRHTQVPPYIPGRTAHVVRRAGPMCPAAGIGPLNGTHPVGADAHIGPHTAPSNVALWGTAPTPHHRSWHFRYYRTRPVGADAHIGPHTAPSFMALSVWIVLPYTAPPNTADTHRSK